MGGMITIDDAKRKQIALRILIGNIIFLHVAAAVLIYSAVTSKLSETDGDTIRLMFSSVMTAIPWCLLVLISDKFVEAIMSRFVGTGQIQPAVIKETKITEVTPQPAPEQPTVNDVNMTVEGDVNLKKE